MKINITLLLLIISSSVFSQVDDTKLKKYKELYDKGLIDSIEYKSLKNNVLIVNNSELDSVRNQKYQETFKIEDRKKKAIQEVKKKEQYISKV